MSKMKPFKSNWNSIIQHFPSVKQCQEYSKEFCEISSCLIVFEEAK